MLKIKTLVLSFFILWFVGNLNVAAQIAETVRTPTPSPMNRDASTVSDTTKSLLWEITGKGLTKPSYLYGTIHIIPKADFFLTDETKKAIAASQKVTFEINMKDMNNPVALMGVMMKAMMPNGMRLKDLVSKEDYTLVKNRFDSIGLPMMMLERIKPMFLSALVDGDGAKMNPMDTTGNQKTVSYEFEIMHIAEKQKKDFGGLETMEFQMGIFDSIPYKAQAEMLVKSIKSGGKEGNSEFAKMVEIYKAQDIEAMSQMMNPSDDEAQKPKTAEENADLAQYESMLVTNRNRNWIPLMAKSMKKQATFFAVGAGHLGGKKGVVRLLRDEGYTVKPLR
jgi:uncharacterized protein